MVWSLHLNDWCAQTELFLPKKTNKSDSDTLSVKLESLLSFQLEFIQGAGGIVIKYRLQGQYIQVMVVTGERILFMDRI